MSLSARAISAREDVKPEPVLVVDDDELAVEFVRQATADLDVEILVAYDRDSALALVKAARPRLVLLDLVIPGVSGMELLESMVEIDPGIDVMLVTGHYSTESAVEAIQKGAYDYLTKPLSVVRLREKLTGWLDEASVRRRTVQLDAALVDAYQFEGIIGRSPLMLDVFSRVRRIAPHFTTMLLTGETGTGKELFARALHQRSPASSGPFVVCNSIAIAESLFESEMFGHVKGAFTGASQDRIGLVENASKGVLFVDEIGEISLSSQAKLLRLIQNREIQRLGSPRVHRVDVRIVAATNRNLRQMVSRGEFREDLYYRLAMVELRLPRLADRREDLPLLERHFLRAFSHRFGRASFSLTRRAQAMLARHSWPGNVRELENALGYCAMMAEDEIIDVHDFPENLRAAMASGDGSVEEDEMLPLREVEMKHIYRVFERVGRNYSKAASVLGISRAKLYRLLPLR